MKTNKILSDFYKIEKKVRKQPFIMDVIKGFTFFIFIFFVIINLELFLFLAPVLKISFIIFFFSSSLFYFIERYRFYTNKKIYNTNKKSLIKQFKLFEIIKNTFQLIDLKKQTYFSAELIDIAIIERKDRVEEVIENNEFKKGINKSRKWAILFLILSLSILLIPFISNKYQNAIKRTLDVTTQYQKPIPYSIIILNDTLNCYKNENFELKVELTGENYPSELYINIYGIKSKLKKEKSNLFSYQFSNVKNTTLFTIETEDFISSNYTLKVIDKARILHYKIAANYPAYLNRENEVFENLNLISVPVGTLLSFEFLSENTEKFEVETDGNVSNTTKNNNVYKFKQIATKNQKISIYSRNSNSSFVDSLYLDVRAIEDEFPIVYLNVIQDSTYENVLYLIGQASDDHGISKTNIILDIFETDNDKRTTKSISIPSFLQPTMFNLSEVVNLLNYMDILPRKIEMYAEVFDNDRIRGKKKGISQKYIFVFKTDEEKKIESEQKQQNQINSMSDISEQSNQLDKQLEELRNLLKTQLNKDWKTQKKIEDLKKKYQELQNKVQNLNKEMKNPLQNENKTDNQKQVEKNSQEMLKKDIESIMNEFDKMLNENKIDKIREQIEQIKQKNESFKKNMDKNLEDVKQKAFDDKFKDVLDKLNEINEKQAELNKQPITKDTKDKISEEQQKLQQKFNEFQKELQKLKDINKELERPNTIIDTQKDEEKINSEMKDSQESVEKNKSAQAKEKQNKTEKSLEELQKKLEENKEQIEEENLDEDIESVRELLKNLIRISISQEELMKSIQKIRVLDPKFNDLIREQKNLEQQYKIIGDTLFALAKRQPEVKSFVLKEFSLIQQNLDGLTVILNENKIGESTKRQQFIMTSTNNLALMLAESLKNMKSKQSESSSSKKKKKSNNQCNSQGNSKKKKSQPKLPDIKKLQESLNDQIKKAGQKIEKGQGSQMSEELARMAAQQEAIRKMLQDYLNDLKQEGNGLDGKIEKIIKDMDSNEKDIVNRNINKNTENRLQQIETRLLESEKAEIEREKEEKRESKEGKDMIPKNADLLKTIELYKKNQQELLKQNPIKLKNYYREKVSKYFLNFEDNK